MERIPTRLLSDVESPVVARFAPIPVGYTPTASLLGEIRTTTGLTHMHQREEDAEVESQSYLDDEYFNNLPSTI